MESVQGGLQARHASSCACYHVEHVGSGSARRVSSMPRGDRRVVFQDWNGSIVPPSHGGATSRRFTRNNRFFHQPSQSWFEMEERGGRFYMRRRTSGYVMEKEIHYVLGSGNHARSYVHMTRRAGCWPSPCPGTPDKTAAATGRWRPDSISRSIPGFGGGSATIVSSVTTATRSYLRAPTSPIRFTRSPSRKESIARGATGRPRIICVDRRGATS